MTSVEQEPNSSDRVVLASTRLFPPRLRPETVDRPGLVARLLSSPAQLGVVTGPAGSGKSTLLALCHDAEPFPAWLSLDSSDNDAVELWLSVIEAVRTVEGGFGEGYRDRLKVGGAAATEEIVVLLCNELGERGTPIHLFLDDLHVLDNELCRQSMHRFVSSIPEVVRVTVASREQAPIPLARLRATGDLVEIGAADLALTAEQAHQLLKPFDATVDQAHLDVLIARTEGWPAGLQLAGLALVQAEDASGFIDGFGGTDRHVADYLFSEVLETHPDQDREFVIETSILSQLTGDLCDAVTGRSKSVESLLRLEQRNAFVIPLDRKDLWFRYHHLFGELVKAELHRTRPEQEAALHRRAFEWLSDNGHITAAIPHALSAGEMEAAADMVSLHYLSMLHSGRTETARRLIASFPAESVADHQPLLVAAAAVYAMAGYPDAARGWLDSAERVEHHGQRPDGMANTASSVALIRGSLAPRGVAAALDDGRTAYRLEPPDSPHRTLAAVIVGRALVMQGKVDEATEFFEEVERSGFTNERGYALAELALGHLVRNEPQLALASADTARTLMHETGGDDLFMTATAHAVFSLAAIELGDERSARVALRAAARPMKSVGQAMPMDATHTRLLLARAALALGEVNLAREHLSDAGSILARVSDVGVMRQEHAELVARLSEQQPRPDRIPDEELTERELEVLAMLPSPLTIREIGQELFVSQNTIKTHVRRLYRKLNARSREEAVMVARDQGLIGVSVSDDRA